MQGSGLGGCAAYLRWCPFTAAGQTSSSCLLPSDPFSFLVAVLPGCRPGRHLPVCLSVLVGSLFSHGFPFCVDFLLQMGLVVGHLEGAGRASGAGGARHTAGLLVIALSMSSANL